MAGMVLITGGARSGKSAYAQRLVESVDGPRIYVATCPILDDELAARVAAHQRDREGRGWKTVEEPIRLAAILAGLDRDATVLVDCLTLWVGNLLHDAIEGGRALDEAFVAARAEAVVEAASRRARPTVLVTNEVGGGIVPADPHTRLYRDLLGRCNQVVAARAAAVTLLVCGIPVPVKGGESRALTS